MDIKDYTETGSHILSPNKCISVSSKSSTEKFEFNDDFVVRAEREFKTPPIIIKHKPHKHNERKYIRHGKDIIYNDIWGKYIINRHGIKIKRISEGMEFNLKSWGELSEIQVTPDPVLYIAGDIEIEITDSEKWTIIGSGCHICSNPEYTDETSCLSNKNKWLKTGHPVSAYCGVNLPISEDECTGGVGTVWIPSYGGVESHCVKVHRENQGAYIPSVGYINKKYEYDEALCNLQPDSIWVPLTGEQGGYSDFGYCAFYGDDAIIANCNLYHTWVPELNGAPAHCADVPNYPYGTLETCIADGGTLHSISNASVCTNNQYYTKSSCENSDCTWDQY